LHVNNATEDAMETLPTDNQIYIYKKKTASFSLRLIPLFSVLSIAAFITSMFLRGATPLS
jgi:hypothetical protein